MQEGTNVKKIVSQHCYIETVGLYSGMFSNHELVISSLEIYSLKIQASFHYTNIKMTALTEVAKCNRGVTQRDRNLPKLKSNSIYQSKMILMSKCDKIFEIFLCIHLQTMKQVNFVYQFTKTVITGSCKAYILPYKMFAKVKIL